MTAEEQIDLHEKALSTDAIGADERVVTMTPPAAGMQPSEADIRVRLVNDLPGDAYDDSELKQRISIEEGKNAELERRDHDSWQNSGTAANAAIVLVTADSIDEGGLAGQAWGAAKAIAPGTYDLFMRIPFNQIRAKYRVVDTGGGEYEDLWIESLVTGGFAYLLWRDDVVVSSNTSFQAQISQLDAHTAYHGFFDGDLDPGSAYEAAKEVFEAGANITLTENDTDKTITIAGEAGGEGGGATQVAPETAAFDNVTLAHSTAETALPVNTGSTPVGTIITARTGSAITLKAGSYQLSFSFDAVPAIRRFAPQFAVKNGATELESSDSVYFRLTSNIRRTTLTLPLNLASDTEVNFVARTVEYAPTSDESGAGGSGALNNIRCLIQPVGGIKGDRGEQGLPGGGAYDDTELRDRISEQEYVTEELEHRTHTNWSAAANAAAAAVWVTPTSSDVGNDQLPGQSWVVTQTGLTSGAHNVYLRIPVGNLVSRYRVSAGTAGVFHDGWAHRLTQGGFVYLEQIDRVVLTGAASFQAQVSGETQNTRFHGWFDGRMSQAAFSSGIAGTQEDGHVVKRVGGVWTSRPDAGGFDQAQVDARINTLRPRPLSAADRVKLDLITAHDYIRGVYMSPPEAPRTLTTSTTLNFHVHVTPNAFPEAASSGRVWVSVGGIEKYVSYVAGRDRYTIPWTPTASEIIELDNNQSWQTASDIRFSVWITAGVADDPALALYQDNFPIRDAIAAGPTRSVETHVTYNAAQRSAQRDHRYFATGYTPPTNYDVLELLFKLGDGEDDGEVRFSDLKILPKRAIDGVTVNVVGDSASAENQVEIAIPSVGNTADRNPVRLAIGKTSTGALLVAYSGPKGKVHDIWFQAVSYT